MGSTLTPEYARLLEATEGDERLAAELIDIFVTDYPSMLTEAEAAVREQRHADLHRIAHTFKGNLRYMGATSATEAAITLETMAISSDLVEAPAAIAYLRTQLDLLMHSLVQEGEPVGK